MRLSKPWRPPRPNLTVRFETVEHYLLLGLILPEIAEDLVLLGIVRRLRGTSCAYCAFCAATVSYCSAQQRRNDSPWHLSM
jgi:hypothetical protein